MAEQAIYRDEVLVVEPHGIEHIKDVERHGTIYSQFNVWFGSNMHLVTIVLGGLGVTLGLGFWGAVLSCALANFLGAIGNSVCVAMGPRLGMPQMPMSRSAFGYKGNYLLAFLAWLGFIGWFTVENALGSQSVQQLFHSPYAITAILFGIVTIIVAVYGYNLVHAWERASTWVSLIAFVVLSLYALAHGLGASAAPTKAGTAYWLAFLLEFTIMFSYTVSWAPYAADYARYLPANTPLSKPFWYSFWGMFLATTWTNGVGALLATLAVKGGVVPAIGTVTGAIAPVLYFVIAVGTISANVLNMYSGAMSGLTWDMPMKRTGAALVIGVAGVVLSAFFGGPQLISFFKAFLFMLVYWVTPWIAIIAIDFYLFNKQGTAYPSVAEFYKRNGIFGSIRWSGLLAFLIGIAVSVPFMATDWYTGPIGKQLAGGDLSYIVSFIVAGAVYLATGRPKAAGERAEAVPLPATH